MSIPVSELRQPPIVTQRYALASAKEGWQRIPSSDVEGFFADMYQLRPEEKSLESFNINIAPNRTPSFLPTALTEHGIETQEGLADLLERKDFMVASITGARSDVKELAQELSRVADGHNIDALRLNVVG